MNKIEFVKAISKRADVSQKNVAAVLEAMQDTIKEVVSNGDKVGITGFVTFEKKHVPAKSGVSKLGGTEKEWNTSEKDIIKASLSKSYSNIE